MVRNYKCNTEEDEGLFPVLYISGQPGLVAGDPGTVVLKFDDI